MSAPRFGVFLSLCLTFTCLISAGCSRQAPPAPAAEVKQYPIHGEIVRLNAKDKLATINAGKIEGWMGAMTMDYPVKNDKDFAALREGQKIEGTVSVQGLDYWISSVHEEAAEKEKKE